MLIKAPEVANFFYSGDPVQLKENVLQYLSDSVTVPVEGKLRGIIAPHAGYIYSGIVAGSCYKLLQNLDQNKKWKVILLGPNHRYPLNGVSVCAYDKMLTPLGEIEVSPIAKEMAKQLGFIPAADKQEHSLEVQLPFLQTVLPNFELIPMLLGRVNVYQVANYLKPYLDDNTILVISTDLSHFFTYEKAVQVDSICNKAIPSLDIETMAKEGDACGIIGVLSSMIMAKDLGWQGSFIDYKNSGDTAGTKDRVVGYGSYAFSSPN